MCFSALLELSINKILFLTGFGKRVNTKLSFFFVFTTDDNSFEKDGFAGNPTARIKQKNRNRKVFIWGEILYNSINLNRIINTLITSIRLIKC